MKREYPFATLPPGQSDLIRELLTYRAHIDTIKALFPHPHVEQVARTHYNLMPDRKTARGATATIAFLLTKRYASMTSRLALNELFAQFDDLRKSGFSFQEALVFVYRSYYKKNHHLLALESAPNVAIRFEHFYALALQLESRQATLLRCSCCGSRNLLSKHVSSQSLQCIFCKLTAISANSQKHIQVA